MMGANACSPCMNVEIVENSFIRIGRIRVYEKREKVGERRTLESRSPSFPLYYRHHWEESS